MYNYETEKQAIFTEKGQVDFLKIRDSANRLIEIAGAVSYIKIIDNAKTSIDDSWFRFACVDRLLELGELQFCGPDNAMYQHRIFIKPYSPR